jgi:hypothetical protein
VQLQATPAQSPGKADAIVVSLGDIEGGLDGFALRSEPSHTLLAFVLNSDRDMGAIRETAWYVTEILPWLNKPAAEGRSLPVQMTAPIRAHSALAFGSVRRDPGDNVIVFSVRGDALAAWRGNTVERVTLLQGGGAPSAPPAWTQAFALVRGGAGLDGTYTCGCGTAPPPPCDSGAGGACSSCVSCSDKGGIVCGCCTETTSQCGQCGRALAICGLECPFC